MSRIPCVLFRSRLLLHVALLVGFTPVLCAKVDEHLAFSVLKNAPLSLPRLAPDGFKVGHKSIRRDAYEVLSMAPGPNARSMTKDGVSYLGIEPGANWKQALRNKSLDVSYVSFTLNASSGTQVDICGASFAIETSQRSETHAAIRAANAGDTIGHEMPWSLFGAARMAPLNIVTVKINRRTGTWSMWFRDSLVSADQTLSDSNKGSGMFEVTAGKGGAWLCGLVCSDENPLFEDANHNAVPDEFEINKVGGLVDMDASLETVQTLRRAWSMARRKMPPTIFVLTTPLPDSFPDLCGPEGEEVHGMTGGRKYGMLHQN